jgi:amino acid transporter
MSTTKSAGTGEQGPLQPARAERVGQADGVTGFTEVEGRLPGRIGTAGIAFSVVGYMAPLAAMTGYLVLVIGYGNGLGAPLAFLLTGLVLVIFSVGFVALVRHVPRPGAFYSYVAASLGRPLGLGVSGISIGSYVFGMGSIAAFMGTQVQPLVAGLTGIDIQWWVWSLISLVLIGLLSFRGIEVNVKVVGVVVIIEVLIILLFNITTLFRGGPDGYALQVFTWDSFSSGSIGFALLFAVNLFSGFEATVVFREEARQPSKTIPRATFIVVISTAIFYAFSAWCLIIAVGTSTVVEASVADPAHLFTNAIAMTFGAVARDVVIALTVTSSLASALSITNLATRYTYSLGVDRVLPRSLGIVHRRFGTPHWAILITSLVAVAIIVAAVVSGSSPVELYSVLSGVVTIALSTVMLLASLSIIVFFRRNRSLKVSIWARLIAPGVAAIALCALVIFSTWNLESLVGVPSALTPIAFGLIVALFLSGIIYASWAARHRPDLYRRIGRAVE